MDDLNAKADIAQIHMLMLSTSGIRNMDENGVPFADICFNHSLVMDGSIFPHKRKLGIPYAKNRECFS